MPLPKQPVPIPLLGGLDGKSAPLVTAPGSHLQLDNVRQERTGEWRRRHGWAQNNADTLPNIGGQQIVRFVELPGGGGFGLTEMSADVNTCARLYSPSAATRWTIPPQFLPLYGGAQSFGSGQASLPLWSRHSMGYTNLPAPFTALAVGNGMQLLAYAGAAAPTNATAVFKTLAENEAQGLSFTFGTTSVTTTATRPRAVYFAGSPGVFLLLWLEGTKLVAQTWDGNGVQLSAANAIRTDVASGSGLDALIYPSSTTATVVYQDSGANFHMLEVSSAGAVVSTVSSSTSSASQCVQLLSNPDGTPGPRFAAISAPSSQRLVRFDATGTTLSTTAIGTFPTVDSFAGVAVNGGGGAVLVLHTSTGGIWAWKMTTSSTPGTLAQLAPDGAGIYIDSNGWREPGTDAMHWIAGLHITLPGVLLTDQTDFQHSFYEMALEYGGSDLVINQFSEPQSRLIPLQAGAPAGCDPQGAIHAGAPCQVVRTGASAFSVPLPRLARVDTGTAGSLQYAIDRWDVLHLNGSNMTGVNLGQGVKTNTAAYLPAGNLLQSVDGQQIVGHGASALPYQPVLTATTGGGMTPSSTYGFLVVVEMFDEAGNVWRSTPSVPAQVPLSAGQNAVAFTMTNFPFEAGYRIRSVRLYRTQANGSTYFLTYKITGPTAATISLSNTDLNSDAQLGTELETALSEGDVGEQPATVTPAFLHVAEFDGRLWGIDRDFPTRVWYSKPILQGTSPEFPASFNFDVIDELGPFTGLAACDDKLVFFKSPLGLYYVVQGGPANDGSGNQYTPVRLSSENGLLLGQPYVSTGAEVFFGARAAGGGVALYRVNRSLEIDWVGVPIDQYLAQPEVNTPDTLVAATYNDARQEIRFMGQNAQYVYDRVHGLWVRDTFPSLLGTPPLLMRNVGGTDMLFLSTGGTVWTEGDETALNDPGGGNYLGNIRSAWLRLAQMGGYFRLYGIKLLLDVVGEASGPQQTILLYFNDSDSNGISVMLSPVNVARGEYYARGNGQLKLGSMSLQIQLASGDTGVRLDGWTAVVGIKEGPRKLTAGQRWQ